MKISFIGGGLMAEALISGILEARLSKPDEIRVGEPLDNRRAYLQKTFQVDVHGTNKEVLIGADIVILAIKPQNLSSVMVELTQNITNANLLVVSIVAGAYITTLTNGLATRNIIRVMPNTPAQIGAGVSVWTATSEVLPDKIEYTRQILDTLGSEIYVDDENLIDMATALSSSGPAYIFLFIESMIDAGVYLGMPRELSRQLVLETISGSTKLVKQSERHPAELKDMVTSPAGTTIEALLAFEKRGFRASIIEAVIAAHRRSKALGERN